VAQGGSVIIDAAFGWSDTGHNVPITTHTKFYIASMTKSFTAIAVLRLRDQKKISLSAPISRYLQDVPAPCAAITIEQLLTHTSGIGENHAADGIVDRKAAVDAVLRRPLSNPPGEAFGYTDDNYVLLAAIVETASGMTYETYLQVSQLTPAKMVDSGFWGMTDINHAENFAGLRSLPPGDRLRANWGDRGASGVVSTADDLYRWWGALQSGTLLSHDSVMEMYEPRKSLSSGTQIAYGWFRSVSDTGLTSLWTRGGEDIGHNAVLVSYPDTGATIIVTSNAGSVDHEEWNRRVKNALEKILFGS